MNKRMLNPQRMLSELKELRELTGNGDGAQRVAFTPTWIAARNWLKKKLESLPVTADQDAAGNLWATLEGESRTQCLSVAISTQCLMVDGLMAV